MLEMVWHAFSKTRGNGLTLEISNVGNGLTSANSRKFQMMEMVQAFISRWDEFHPKAPCHWDEIHPNGWRLLAPLGWGFGWINWDNWGCVFCILVIGGASPPFISKVQNTQPQLSQLIHPKPHPNGATNLHPLGWFHHNGKGPWDDFVHHWDDSSQSSHLHYRPA